MSSSSSPTSAQRRRKDRFIPKRREMEKPSEIFEGREKGFGNRGRTTGSMKNKRRRRRTTLSWNEERTCYGPFWLRLRNGPSRADDRQERGFSQNGVVDRRHDSSRSPFPRRKRNGNSRRNPSRIDEEGIRSWLQVGARTLGRGIGGIQR